jgi:hypothetical protein
MQNDETVKENEKKRNPKPYQLLKFVIRVIRLDA